MHLNKIHGNPPPPHATSLSYVFKISTCSTLDGIGPLSRCASTPIGRHYCLAPLAGSRRGGLHVLSIRMPVDGWIWFVDSVDRSISWFVWLIDWFDLLIQWFGWFDWLILSIDWVIDRLIWYIDLVGLIDWLYWFIDWFDSLIHWFDWLIPMFGWFHRLIWSIDWVIDWLTIFFDFCIIHTLI